MRARRTALTLVVAIVGAVVLARSAAVQPAAAAATRPNILLILTDDQRRGTDTLQVMPRTRLRFGDRGTEFVNAVVTTPLCCPSRGSIFTGRYAHNHGALVNGAPEQTDAFDQRWTVQRYLQDDGYRTALIGKYFTTWPARRSPPHFDRFAYTKGGYVDPIFNVDGRRRTYTGYSTDLMAGFATGLLREFEAANDAQPWFMYIGTHAPHSTFTPSTRYADAAVPSWSGNPAVFETDESDKPASVRNSKRTFQDGTVVRADQLRTLMSVDDMVESVLDELAALGELSNTFAVFTSDNGYMWAEHGIIEKRFPYLQAVQVPLLMRWPGHVAAGVDDTRLAANIDIAPTILEAAGITPDPALPMDGRSLFSTTKRSRILLEYFRSPDAKGMRSWAAILTAGLEYVEWYDDDLTTVRFREYYDLVADPWQVTNLLGDGNAANDPPTAALRDTLRGVRDCVGSECWLG